MPTFVVGEMVDVVFLGEERSHRAQVIEGSVGTAMLELTAPLDMPPTAMVGHLDRGEGSEPVEGVLKSVGDGVRVRFMAGSISNNGHARRRHARIQVEWDCEIALRNGRRWNVVVRDLSAGGMLVESGEHLDPNAVLKFTLTLDGRGPIMGHAKSLRQTPSGAYALQFLLLPDVAADELMKVIEEVKAAAGDPI